jgi:hypothetical protein
VGGHTYAGLPQTWWNTLSYRLRGLRPPSHSGCHGSARRQRRDIEKTIRIIQRHTGRQIVSWRSHGLVRDKHTYPLLAAAGIRLISDEISATKLHSEPTPSGLLSHPINTLPDHDHLLHAHRDDAFVAAAKQRGYGADAFGCDSYPIERWGEIVAEQVAAIEAQGGVATVLMHPVCQFLADQFRTAEKLFALFARYRTVWARELLHESNTSTSSPGS